MNLLYNRVWDAVLDKLAEAQELVSEEGEPEETVLELDGAVSNAELSYERILEFYADDGSHYMLSVGRAACIEKKFIPAFGESIHYQIDMRVIP